MYVIAQFIFILMFIYFINHKLFCFLICHLPKIFQSLGTIILSRKQSHITQLEESQLSDHDHKSEIEEKIYYFKFYCVDIFTFELLLLNNTHSRRTE